MTAKEKLKKFAEKLDLEVEKILDHEFARSKRISPIIARLIDEITPIPAYGGKRIRGAFIYYSYLMHGGKNLKEIMKIAAAIELIHAYLLIHDDIMDQALLRRNMPTIHKKYADFYEEVNAHNYHNGVLRTAAKHFGESMAINAGDILCHLATQIMVDSDFPVKNKIRALSLFHRKIVDTGYGQVIDVYGELEEVTEDYILQVHLFKTGYYTYQLPLHIGAILAGANDKDLAALTRYALPAGVAFQLQDDVIDLFGEDTGKIIGGDIKEGKRTLLIIKAYQNADHKDKIILDNALGNKHLTEKTFEVVKKIIKETGSLEYSIKKSKKLLEKSTRELLKYTKHKNEGTDFLVGINDYMLNRKM